MSPPAQTKVTEQVTEQEGVEMEMKVNAKLIKTEREKRAWSQEHLAGVSGLGVRTIQRIESTGLASYESTKAIAAALELKANDLSLPKEAAPAPDRQADSTDAGSIEAGLVESELQTPRLQQFQKPDAVSLTYESTIPSTPPPKARRSRLKETLPPIMLAFGIILAAAVSIPSLNVFWWVGPVILSAAAIAARMTKNRIESRGNAGLLRTIVLALASMLAFAIVAVADAKSVAVMIPILGAGLTVVLHERRTGGTSSAASCSSLLLGAAMLLAMLGNSNRSHRPTFIDWWKARTRQLF